MAIHVHTVSQLQHHLFIKQERKDPFTKQMIQADDRIVFCAICKTAFLVSSWEAIHGKHCNQQNTLRDFPTQQEYLKISKKSKNPLTRLSYWFYETVGSVEKGFLYEFLTYLIKRVFEAMSDVEACKVHFIVSTIFFPLALVTIFLGIEWSLGILLLALSIVALKHFLVSKDITTESINVFNNTSLDFILGKIVHFTLLGFFSFKNISQYINHTTDDDNELLADLLWVLYFCLISIVILNLHFGLYLFSTIFIVVIQKIIFQ